MKRWSVAILLLVLLSGVALAGDNGTARAHASDQAWQVVPYQSALTAWREPPGIYLATWMGEVGINTSQVSHYRVAWGYPVGTARRGYPENGAGSIKVRLWADGQELRLNKTGLTDFFGDDMWQLRVFWYVFPAGFFSVGDHLLSVAIDVPKLGVHDTGDLILHVSD